MPQILQYLTDHPTLWVFVAFTAISLIQRRQASILAWIQKNPRLAGGLKLAQALGIDPIKALDALALLALGRVPAAKAKKIAEIVAKLLAAGALAVTLLGCAAKPPTVAQVNDAARVALVATDAALAAVVDANPNDRTLDPLVDRMILAKGILEKTDATLDDVCSTAELVGPVAAAVDCDACSAAVAVVVAQCER